MIADPRTAFPQFYENPAILTLASTCRWTISGQIGELGDPDDPEQDGRTTRKAPIDLRHLLEFGRVRGAWSISSTCLLTLDELTDAVPAAANAAFYLQSQVDGLAIIDIEPECPAEVAMELLRLPGILYSELSMSGRGYHLVVAQPKNFRQFPVAAGKRVLREEHGWYEILLDHWTTFTRKPIPHAICEAAAALSTPPRFDSVEALYAELGALARESPSVSSAGIDTGDGEVDLTRIRFGEDIVEATLASARERLRDPEDFDNDMSRWEFSVLGTAYGMLRTQLSAYSAFGSYDGGQRSLLLYAVAKELIPFRPKHAQTRNGRPFLLDRAAALVAARLAAEEQARQDSGACA
jgi:hypothetical protein